MVQKENLRVGAKSHNGQSKNSQGNSKPVIKKGRLEREVLLKHMEICEEICDPQSSDSEFDTKPYRDFLYKTGSEQRNLIHMILIELEKEPAPPKALKLVEQLVLDEPGLFTQCDISGKTPLLEAAQHNVGILCHVIDLLIPEPVLKDIKIPCGGRDRTCPLSRVNKGRQRQFSKNRRPTGSASADDPGQAEQIDGPETTEVQQDENDDVKLEGSCLCNLIDTDKVVKKDAQLRETLKAALGREQERQPLCLHLLIVNLELRGKEHTGRIPLDKFEILLQLCPDTVFESTTYDGYSPLQTAIRLYDKPFIDYQHLFLIIQALVNRLPSSIDVKAGYKAGGDRETTAYRLLKGLSKTGDNINAQSRSRTEDLLKRICIGSTSRTWDSMRDFLYSDAKSVRQICLNLCGESRPLDESYISTIIDWSGMLFETVMVSVKLPYWRPQHEKSQGQDVAPGHRGGIGSDVVAVLDPYIAIFQWLHESGVEKIFTVEVDDTGPDPHTNSAIRQSLRGSTCHDKFSRDFKIEVWKWKKFDLCSETIVDAAPMAKEVHLYSSGNTAVLRSWACSSGLPKLSELQQLEINIYPRNANDEADCRQYVPELRKKLASRCRRLENEKINVKYPDSHAAPGGSKRAAQAGSDGEDQENISRDDNNSSNATLKSSEWILKLEPFVTFIANVLDASKKKPSVRVALLDDGANLNDLRGEQKGESFRPDKAGYFVGPCSHGTEMARCIRAICPMAELYIARLDDSRKRDGEVFTSASAYEALKWAISMEVDIISMSWTFKMKVNEMDDYEDKFIRQIRDITSSVGSNKPILFGSYPDKGPTAEALQYAPVGLAGVIGIASATIYGEPSKENTQENPDFLLPGENLEISAGKYVSGSSFSTAYASGLAALVLYCLRAHKDLGDDYVISDSEDERHKRLKNAETGDGMTKIFRNFTRNPADNSFKKDPFVRPYNILGNKNFGLSDHERRKTMQDIVTELLPNGQLKNLSALS